MQTLINQQNQILEQLKSETNLKTKAKLFKQLQLLTTEIFILKNNLKKVAK